MKKTIERYVYRQFVEDRLYKSAITLKREEENSKLQAEWMRRCVKVPFKPIMAPVIPGEVGLAAFLAYAKEVHSRCGDQDAEATLCIFQSGRWGAR